MLESRFAHVFRVIGDDIVTAATFATDNIFRSTKWMSMICLQFFLYIHLGYMEHRKSEEIHTECEQRDGKKERERDPHKIKQLKYIKLCLCVYVMYKLMFYRIVSYRCLLILTRFFISFPIYIRFWLSFFLSIFWRSAF